MKQEPDRVIWRPEICNAAGVVGTTIWRWIQNNTLPKPDVYMSRKRYGWRLATLREHGINWV